MKLTKEQKALVEENINLVYYFCNKHNIQDEDFKSTLVCKFITIVQKYNKYEGKFSTFIYYCLENEYRMYLRNMFSKKRYANLTSISFQSTVAENVDTTLSDIIEDTKNNIEDCINRQYISQILEYLKSTTSARDFSIFLGYLIGKNQAVIAKENNMSQPQVSRIIRKIQKSLRKDMM